MFSQVLFNSGEDIEVRSVEPGFPEPWDSTVEKSISVLHKYGKSIRIFVCKEFTGRHYIKPGSVSKSNIYNAELREINPFPNPTSSQVKILAIVWGPKEIRSQAVYNSCYRCFEKQPIKFANDNFGGDTWYSMPKSGMIYYVMEGGDSIYQVCGRENSEKPFI